MLRPKRTRVTEIFPEVKRIAREIERFKVAAAEIDALLAQDQQTVARLKVRALLLRLLGTYSDDMRPRLIHELSERWGYLIDVGACVEEYRYRQEYKQQTRSRGW